MTNPMAMAISHSHPCNAHSPAGVNTALRGEVEDCTHSGGGVSNHLEEQASLTQRRTRTALLQRGL